MAVITLNVGEMENLRNVFHRRVGDLRTAQERVHRVRADLAVDFTDPAVRPLPDLLGDIDRRLDALSLQLDASQRGMDEYLRRAIALDRSSAGGSIGLGALTARLGPSLMSRSRVDRAQLPQRLPVDSASRMGSLVGKAVQPGLGLLRRSERFALRTGQSVTRGARRLFDRYVSQPWNRLKTWLAHAWHKVSEAFSRAWNAAWARLAGILRGLRNIVITIATAPAALAVLLSKEWRLVTGTRFETVKDHAPGAYMLGGKDETYTGSVKVDIPLKPPFGMSLEASMSAKITRFSDGTVEVTLDEEFEAGVYAALEKSSLDDATKAKIRASIKAAIGHSATYRIRDGMIGNRPAYAVFIEQQILRMVLQGIALSGTPAAIAAGLLLRRLPPEPSPISHSEYMKYTATVELALTAGATGAAAGAQAQVKAAIVDGGAAYEFTASAEAGASSGGGGAGAGAHVTAEMRFRVNLDKQGHPVSVDLVTVHKQRHKVFGGVGTDQISGGATGEIEDVDTATTHIPISAANRDHIGQLALSAATGHPASAQQLAGELNSMAGSSATTHTHETFRVTTEQAAVGGGPVELELKHETRTRVNPPAPSGGSGGGAGGGGGW